MWKCPKCKNKNNGEFCTVCQQPKPAVIKESHSVLLAICILLSITLLTLIGTYIYITLSSDNDSTNSNLYELSKETQDKKDESDQKEKNANNESNSSDGYDYSEYVTNSHAEANDNENASSDDGKKSEKTKSDTYATYVNYEYAFECAYPLDLTEVPASGVNALKTFESENSDAKMVIRACKNPGNVTVQTGLSDYKKTYPGTVTYEAKGDTWYAISVDNGDILYYRKFFLANGNIYCMDFSFNEKDLEVYAPKIEYIEDNFHVL